MGKRRKLLVIAVPLVAVVLAVWFYYDPSIEIGGGTGVRVDTRDMASACNDYDPPACLGSFSPKLAVDPHRRRVLVVWEGNYDPHTWAVYARELDEEGKPVGQPRLLFQAQEDDSDDLAASYRNGGYEVFWNGTTRSYTPEVALRGERRGAPAPGESPDVVHSGAGFAALMPGGERVVVEPTVDRQIRAGVEQGTS